MNKFLQYFDSPTGIIELTADSTSLLSSNFVEAKTQTENSNSFLDGIVNQLDEYFNRKRIEFDFTIAPEGTDFQKRVWKELLKIPFGKTISYNTLAKRLGDEKVIRAAANANGKNPIGIIIPCHRVIGSDGSLTGYAGGLWRKKWLLDFESGSLKLDFGKENDGRME